MTIPPAASRWRTSNETAGGGQGLSGKPTGGPPSGINSAAGGDDHSAGGVSLANQQRDGGRGAGLVGQPYGRAACGDNVSDCCGHSIGCKAMIVADDYASARVFGANYVAGDRARNGARVRKSEVFGNDGAPAV